MFRILVIDDDKNVRRFMQAVLEEEHYTVFTAGNGEEALAVMETQHVDLAVLDIMMPGMDGFTFTRILRESDNDLPILMVSAKQLPADRKQAFMVGTDDYMTKPIDPEEFLRFANDVADADTVAFYSFDKWFGNPFEMSPAWGEFSNYFVNETPFVNPPKATLTPRESATIPFLTDENAGTVRNGLVSPTAVADLGSISAVTNGYGQAFGFAIDTTTPEQLYMAGDFTAEGFVKLNSLPDSTDYLMRGLLTQGGVDNTWLVTVGSNGKLNFSINWQKNVSTPTSVVSDFGWHHVAVVSTPATSSARPSSASRRRSSRRSSPTRSTSSIPR